MANRKKKIDKSKCKYIKGFYIYISRTKIDDLESYFKTYLGSDSSKLVMNKLNEYWVRHYIDPCPTCGV